jgi:tRNA-splicing ligase RtcB
MEKISDRLYSWASILEWDTREQARKASAMPFVFPHVALMPDAHLGRGACVGMVLPTVGAIIPAAVGVDAGCGIMAVRTQFTMKDIEGIPLPSLRESIETAIPLSAGNYNQEWWHGQTASRVKELEGYPGAGHAEDTSPNWRLQLGSLGSGNHFIEISCDEQERVWLFLHSGSRGVGNRLMQKHIKVARQLRKDDRLPEADLAWLEEGTPQFDDYITDLRWSQHFALLNRAEMMDRVTACFSRWADAPVEKAEAVQCHHNYTEIMPPGLVAHYGWDGPETIWLSRKGAIDASEGKAD